MCTAPQADLNFTDKAFALTEMCKTEGKGLKIMSVG